MMTISPTTPTWEASTVKHSRMDWATRDTATQSVDSRAGTSVCWATLKSIPSCKGASGKVPVMVIHSLEPLRLRRVSSVEEFFASAALSFPFCLCFIFLLHLLFVSSYSTLNIGSPNNESLLVNNCSTWFSIMKMHLSRHHILPSKLHLLLSRTDLILHSPHALLIITQPPVATYSVSRTL
jgi:hypothetical protein